jgi:uncharacterized protein with NAD-binding domain and iron-sulfur cluster
MTDETPDVTIVGAGMAGMTAAAKLLAAGFSVKVIEASSGVGGKFGAIEAKGARHDYAWHIFGDWYPNFWALARDIGLSKQNDFEPRPTLTLLRPLDGQSAWPRTATITSIGSPETFWSTATSGVAHWSDVMLFAYSQYSLLCDTSLDREEFLNRVTVNGYMRSLPHMSDVAALLHNELLLRIWAIPSYLISARSYRTHLALIAPFRSSESPLLVMKQNFQDGFWRPFLEYLRSYPRFTLVRDTRLMGIRLATTRDRVDEIVVSHGAAGGSRAERVQSLIVAIPPDRLLQVVSAPDSLALRQEVPSLLGLAKLDAQYTASLTLCLKGRLDIPGVTDQPVTLVDDLESIYAASDLDPRNGLASEYGISFMDVTGLREPGHPTILVVLASDADSLRSLDDEEACQRVVAELQRYVRFDDSDIDWSRSYYQPHTNEPLFVNSVGSWEYRPEVRVTNSEHQALGGQVWRTIRNLYLAGDYCRSQIDIVSLEGAVHTGIWAAHALSSARRAQGDTRIQEVPEPIRPVPADLDRAKGVRAGLERWAELAARRSLLVKEDLLAAAARRVARPSSSVLPVSSSTAKETLTRRAGGRTMSAVLSTYPTFSSPTDTGRDWAWLTDPLRMTKPVTLKSGAIASVPFYFWETQSVCLQGVADAESVDLLLRDQGLRATHVDPAAPLVEKPGSGVARVRIWATSYGGTTVGPIRTVYSLVHVRPRRECRKNEKDEKPDHWWWWWYFGDSAVNQEFKRDVWGVANELAPVEMSFLTGTKIVRVLENGGTALRITCPVTPTPPAAVAAPAYRGPQATFTGVPASVPTTQVGGVLPVPAGAAAPVPDLRFRLVARRSHDDGENWVNVKLGGPVQRGDIPKDDDRILYVRKDSTIDRHLRGAGFRARTWSFYEEYHGVIEMWDEKGSGKEGVRDKEDKFEVVRQGDGWLIREFDK